ncbi:MAG: hypothetical protein PF638_14965 [Candidatus Delongbacteria bacterium]|jgi:hypothetical protein|nr:hypothetical protein [Candidatus Delongbacteria bacterium]
MKKTLSILMLLMMLSFMFAQEEENAEGIQDSLAVAGTDSTIVIAEPVKELTDEEKLCKNAADEIMVISENWDVSRDYDILMPRITKYADSFFNAGKNPNEANKNELLIIKEKLSKLLEADLSSSLRGLLESNLLWVENEISGKQINPALTGYLNKSDQDKVQAIYDLVLLEDSKDDQIIELISDIKSSYKIILRYTIGFDEMLNKVYNEVSRVTEKRVYFLYIEDDVQAKLESISGVLGDYIRNNKDKYTAQIKEDIETAYQAKKKAEEEVESLSIIAGDTEDEVEKKTLHDSLLVAEEKVNQYYDQWLDAKSNTLDNIYMSEITRILAIVNKFREVTGIYDINSELIAKIVDNDPALESYFKNILKIKFSHDLASASKKYFRFDVDKGFRKYRTNVLIFTLMFFGLFFYVFFTIKKKKDSIYIRKIPGLDAIDEAVGRATEMGKPIIYDSGLGSFTEPQTIASMLILRAVAKKVAEFKAEIIYPAYDPIVLQIAEEMISSGFLDAGYPEDHKKDNCFFMVQDQFAYAAGLSGLIARKKPATALHFGSYAAESLLIAEAGFAAGAIQVAGTVESAQLPFFITACDYTLIGEELYAAAAYLSRDAQILSNLKLSDYGKLIFGGLFVLSTVLLTINSEWTFIRDLLTTH